MANLPLDKRTGAAFWFWLNCFLVKELKRSGIFELNRYPAAWSQQNSWRLDRIDQHHVAPLVLPVPWIFHKEFRWVYTKNSPCVILAKTDRARNACCGTTTLPKLFIRDLWSSPFSLSRTSHLCMGVVLPAFHGRLAKWSIGGAWQWRGQQGQSAECYF